MEAQDYKKWIKKADAFLVNGRWVCKNEPTIGLVIYLSYRDDFNHVYELTIIEEALNYCYIENRTLYIQDKSGKLFNIQRLFLEE